MFINKEILMKISFLLTQRDVIQQQAKLSSLAYAYERLTDFTTRIARARLRGQVHLRQADPNEEHYQTSLSALEGNQSVIEEYFTDRDLLDFVDAVGYATNEAMVDVIFDLREVEGRFLSPLRTRLEKSGVVIDLTAAQPKNLSETRPSQGATGEDENKDSR